MSQQYRFTKRDGTVAYAFVDDTTPDRGVAQIRRLMKQHGTTKAEPVEWVCPMKETP